MALETQRTLFCVRVHVSLEHVNMCVCVQLVCACVCVYASQIQLFIISSANMVWLFYVFPFFFAPVLFIIYYTEAHNVWVK